MKFFTYLKESITKLDRNPSTPTPNYNKVKSKQNFLGGLLGLTFIILTIYLVISKGLSIINKNDVILTSFIQRDLSKVDIKGRHISLWTVRFDYETGDVNIIKFSEYLRYGIWPFIVEEPFNMSSDHPSPIKIYGMKLCEHVENNT